MKKYIIYISLSLVAGLFACTDNFEELNTNPNAYNSDDINPGYQLSYVMLELAGDCDKVWHYDLSIASPAMQYFAGSWFCAQGGQYKLMEAPAHWWELWDLTYPRELKELNSLIVRTDEVEEWKNENAAARIMKVYTYQKLTDMFGDIPYSESGKLVDDVLKPKYDLQKDIYSDFFSQLDKAIAMLDEDAGPVDGDLMFDGDVMKWKRFASSLRMRLAMRLFKVDEELAKAQFLKAQTDGVMQGTEDGAIMYYQNAAYNSKIGEIRGNGYAQTFHREPRSAAFCLTNTFVDYMKGTNDPRLYVYGGTYLDDQWTGDITYAYQEGLSHGGYRWANGEQKNTEVLRSENPEIFEILDETGNSWMYEGDVFKAENATWSFRYMEPSKYMANIDNPYLHLTYAEVLLFELEAILRGWVDGDAELAYSSAVTEAINTVKLYKGVVEDGVIEDADIEQYLLDNPWPATVEEQFEALGNQFWMLFYMNGIESHVNWRRLGYPDLEPFDGIDWYPQFDTEIPRRMLYPEFEAQNNPDNYQEALDRMGGVDDWKNRVWWDVK